MEFVITRKAEIKEGKVHMEFKVNDTSLFRNSAYNSFNDYFKNVTIDEYKNIINKYKKELEDNGFLLDYHFHYGADFVKVDVNKNEVKEKTKLYIDVISKIIKELRELNSEKDISNWLKEEMEFRI